MAPRLIAAFVVLLGALGLSGCFFVWSHSRYEVIHDHQVTYDDFNDTVDFWPASGAPEAYAPMSVHEFNHGSVQAAGGYQAVDGQTWFGAGGARRNEILNDIQRKAPKGSVVVIEVASGEIWVVPPGAASVFRDSTITPWTYAEYRNLPDYVADTTGFGYYGPNINTYRQLTAIAATSEVLRQLIFVHPVTQLALANLVANNGFAFAPYPKWRFLSPVQRAGLLLNLQRFLLMTAFYGNSLNPFMFAVSVPTGNIYAVPEMAIWRLAAVLAIYAWTQQQVLALSAVGILPPEIIFRAFRGALIRRQEQVD